MGEGNEWSYATTLHEMFDETDLKYVMTYVRYSDDKNKLMNYARENDIVLNIESVTIINALTNSNLKIEEGRDEGRAVTLVNHVVKCMNNTGASLDDTLKMLGETMEEYLKAKSIVDQEAVSV